ncbi:MAG: hypothetical protein LBC77_00215 [Spirochaetaceae bacterium]|jgi:energy-coupling factor transporter transmembrane protein EcfT|nr:hypothetical protein [Spirochaetaceae bacterium]
MEIGFCYRRGHGILYRANAGIKLLLLFVFSIAVTRLPVTITLVCNVLAAVFALYSGFTIKEFLIDIKPALYYALFLYAAGALSSLSPRPGVEFFLYASRLFFIIQISALFFRGTTSIEIKDTLCDIELFSRRLIVKLPFAKRISLRPRHALRIALALSFIPQLFSLWHKLNTAYRARGGKGGIQKIRLLLRALLSLSFHAAAEKARALAARGVI